MAPGQAAGGELPRALSLPAASFPEPVPEPVPQPVPSVTAGRGL